MDTHLQSLETGQLFAALVNAQFDGLIAISGKTNTQFGSKYADLISVWEAVRPILNKHRLAVSQHTGRVRKEGDKFVIGLRTTLAHESGQYVSDYGEFVITFSRLSDTWASASALTYLRRYGMCAILGIVTGDDNDAQSFAEAHAAAPTAGAAALSSAATGDFAAFVGGMWKDQHGPDGRPLGQYKGAELKTLLANSIKEGNESEALKACAFDGIEARLRALGEHLVPALEERGWKGIPDPAEWSLSEFREAGMLLLTNKATAGGVEP